MKYEYIFTNDEDMWQRISKHQYTTLEIIDANPNKPWDWARGISLNPNLLLAYVLSHMARPWDWINISKNPGITRYDVEAYPELPWNWRAISNNTNPSFTMNFFAANLNKELCWVGLSYHPQLTIEFVKTHLDKPWHWPDISQNPAISLSDITENPELPWDWSWIPYNPNVTPEFVPTIESHCDEQDRQDRLWHRLSHNDNLTSDFIYENRNRSWSWSILIKYHKFSLEDIKGRFRHRFMLYPKYINTNPNYTIEELLDIEPELKDNRDLTLNPNCTFVMADSFTHTRYSIYNMLHLFTREYRKFQVSQYRCHLAAYRIQQWWHQIRSNPYHPIGRKRLEREYDELPFTLNYKHTEHPQDAMLAIPWGADLSYTPLP
jgi:hypothetical protein